MTLIRFWRRLAKPIPRRGNPLVWEVEDVLCLVWNPTQPPPEGWAGAGAG